jgi:hypothetical protein
MQPPFLYKGKRRLKVSAETVFATVKSIVDAGEEERFLRLCKRKKAGVLVDPELINLVKTYLFKGGVHKKSMTARDVVSSARCDPP